MDNRIGSQIKRALKVTSDYFISLILFQVFFVPVISIAKDSMTGAVPYLSAAVFLMLFYMLYVDMRGMAFKEKRPQYNINPSPYKGLLYGAIGVIPLLIADIAVLLTKVPEDYATLKRRILQGISGPLYWFAKLIGNEPAHYILAAVLVVIIAGMGYYAGHKDFMLVDFIRSKLGIEKTAKKHTGGQSILQTKKK
jgi:hypothetical protein